MQSKHPYHPSISRGSVTHAQQPGAHDECGQSNIAHALQSRHTPKPSIKARAINEHSPSSQASKKKVAVRIQPLVLPAAHPSLLTNCSRLRMKKKTPPMTLQVDNAGCGRQKARGRSSRAAVTGVRALKTGQCGCYLLQGLHVGRPLRRQVHSSSMQKDRHLTAQQRNTASWLP